MPTGYDLRVNQRSPEEEENYVRSNVQQHQCQHRDSVSLVFVYWKICFLVSYRDYINQRVVTIVVLKKYITAGMVWNATNKACYGVESDVSFTCAPACCGCIIMKYFHKCMLSGNRHRRQVEWLQLKFSHAMRGCESRCLPQKSACFCRGEPLLVVAI